MKRLFTVHLEHAAGNPSAATKFALTPLAPTVTVPDPDGGTTELAAGIALAPALDLAIAPDPHIGTLNAAGDASVMLVPEADTVTDGEVGLWWRLTFGPDAETITTPHITFAMPDYDVRLDDLFPLRPLPPDPAVTGWVVAETAPAAPAAGLGWWQPSLEILRIWSGTAWAGVGGGASATPEAIRDALASLTDDDRLSIDHIAGAPTQRVLVDVPAATAATVDRIVLNDGELELTRTRTVGGTAPTAEFAELQNADFLGYLTVDPSTAGTRVGQWYWNRAHNRPRVVTDLDPIAAGEQLGFVDAALTELIPGDETYLGVFGSDSDAAAGSRDAEVGDVYFNSAVTELRRVTSITAGTAGTAVHDFERVATADDVGPLTTAVEAARSDVDAVETRTDRLEELTGGIDLIIDDPVWEVATSAEFAAFATGAGLGAALLAWSFGTDVLDLADPAVTDATWQTAGEFTNERILLIRIRNTEPPTGYRVRVPLTGAVEQVYTSTRISTDAHWHYYLGGVYGSRTTLQLEEQTPQSHTAWTDHIAGDALAQVVALTQTGGVEDNSLTPAKAQADTPARQRAWRQRIAASHIGAGTALPDAANSNIGDTFVFTQDVAAGISWTSGVTSPTTITSATAGDVAVFFGARYGWTRVGNVIDRFGTRSLQVTDTADAGDSDLAAREDHVHDLATDSTLAFTAADVLGVPDDGLPETKLDAAARAKLNAAAAALARTQRLVPISTWVRTHEARTLHLAWYPTAAVARGATLTVTVGGTPNNITLADGIDPAAVDHAVLAVPVNAVNATNITAASDTRAGYVEVQVAHAGNVDTCFLRAVAAPPARFETAVGASPAVLPAAAHTIHARITTNAGTGNQRDHTRTFLVSELGADRRWSVESGNAGTPGNSRDLDLSLAYVPATRTLTYSLRATADGSAAAGDVTLTAIGEE